MRALVMAAGLGTRLRPLTDNCPKPLVHLGGRPMIEYCLDHLADSGVLEALVNIHYLPAQMQAFVDVWNKRGRVPHLTVQDESKMILGSGGAVALAAEWLFAKDDLAIICNADVICDPSLAELEKKHRDLQKKFGVECTLAVMSHPEAGIIYTGLRVEGEFVRGFEKSDAPNLMHFASTYMMAKSAIQRLPVAGTEFSIVDVLWKKLAAEKKLGAWKYLGEFLDLGTVQDLKNAESILKGRGAGR